MTDENTAQQSQEVWYVHYDANTGEIKGAAMTVDPWYEILDGEIIETAVIDPANIPENNKHYTFDGTAYVKKSDEYIASYEAEKWAKKRRIAYPVIVEQLDKLFHDINNGTLDQTGEFFTAIKSVKDQYPKPTE